MRRIWPILRITAYFSGLTIVVFLVVDHSSLDKIVAVPPTPPRVAKIELKRTHNGMPPYYLIRDDELRKHFHLFGSSYRPFPIHIMDVDLRPTPSLKPAVERMGKQSEIRRDPVMQPVFYRFGVDIE